MTSESSSHPQPRALPSSTPKTARLGGQGGEGRGRGRASFCVEEGTRRGLLKLPSGLWDTGTQSWRHLLKKMCGRS